MSNAKLKALAIATAERLRELRAEVEASDEAESCPACGGPGMTLGALGRVTWATCRDCGWMFRAGE